MRSTLVGSRGRSKVTVQMLSPATSSPLVPSSYIGMVLGVLAPRRLLIAGSWTSDWVWTHPTKNIDLPGLSLAHLNRSMLPQLPFSVPSLKSTLKTRRILVGSGQPAGLGDAFATWPSSVSNLTLSTSWMPEPV